VGAYVNGYGPMFLGMGWGGTARIVVYVAIVAELARSLFSGSRR
jgi:hypothetical protein